MPNTPSDQKPEKEYNDALDAVFDLYQPGELPGCSPIEMAQASLFGFNRLQIEQALNDARLSSVVQKVWDENGVPERVRRQAAKTGDLATALNELLQRTGHSITIDQTVSDIDWVLLADSVLGAGATKGAGPVADTTRWTVDDRFVDATVLVEVDDVGYRVRCVPEVTRGQAWLVVRWSNASQTRTPVVVTAGEPLDVQVENPAGQVPDAIAFIGR